MIQSSQFISKEQKYSHLPLNTKSTSPIMRVSHKIISDQKNTNLVQNQSTNFRSNTPNKIIRISLNSRNERSQSPNFHSNNYQNPFEKNSFIQDKNIQLYNQKKKPYFSRIIPKLQIEKNQLKQELPQTTSISDLSKLSSIKNDHSFVTRESQFYPQEGDDIFSLKKEIWELQKALKAEKEQNQYLISLGKEDLICVEEVEVKKVYGKQKDVNQKKQTEEIFKRNEILMSQLSIKNAQINQLQREKQLLENQQKNTQRIRRVSIPIQSEQDLLDEKQKNSRYLKNIGELREQIEKSNQEISNLKNNEINFIQQIEQKNNEIQQQQQEQEMKKSSLNQEKNLLKEKEELQSQLKELEEEIMQKDENLHQFEQKKNEQELQLQQNQEEILLLREQIQNLQFKLQQQEQITQIPVTTFSHSNNNHNNKELNDISQHFTDELKSLKKSIKQQNQSFFPEQEKDGLKSNIKYLNKKYPRLLQDIIKLLEQNFNTEPVMEYKAQSVMNEGDLSSIFIQEDKTLTKQKSTPFASFKDIKIQDELRLTEQDMTRNTFQDKLENFNVKNFEEIKKKLKNILQQMNLREQQYQLFTQKIAQSDNGQIKVQDQQQSTSQEKLFIFIKEIQKVIQEIVKDYPLEDNMSNISQDHDAQIEAFLEQLRSKLQEMIQKIRILTQEPYVENSMSFQFTEMQENQEENWYQQSQELSDKVIRLHNKISQIEKKLKLNKKNQKQINQEDYKKLQEENDKLRQELNDQKEKEISLKNKILTKKQNMLKELNSFVTTKKKFESSFLSEITKNQSQFKQFNNNEPLKLQIIRVH